MKWDDFAEIWCEDFEFGGDVGRPEVRCYCAREIKSGRLVYYWADDLYQMRRAPISTGPHTLVVAHYATAEAGCYLELGWPHPDNRVDTFIEWRRRFNSDDRQPGNLLAVAHWAGVADLVSVDEKEAMRNLAIRGGPYTEEEKLALLEYCQSDVDALAQIVPRLLDEVDLTKPLALDQHYIRAAAAMERRGIPLDTGLVRRFVTALPAIKQLLPRSIDPSCLVWRKNGSFDSAGFVRYCGGHGIAPPRLPSRDPRTGRVRSNPGVNLQDDALRILAKQHPKEIGPIREARYIIGELKLEQLAIGADGRNRCLLSMYQSKTGRNQPSNAKFIFGPARWARSFIKPAKGMAIAYLDWQAQEFAVAAALSGDKAMLADYATPDPYLAGAIRAGLAPVGATKKSHPELRAKWKVVGGLAALYGMGPESLAARLDVTELEGRRLLRLHRETYPDYWRFSEAAGNRLFGTGVLETPFGWRFTATSNTRKTTGMNWPVQATGAEMMRVAAALMVANGVPVCCPIHDAFLIEATDEDIEFQCLRAVELMELASRKVLKGVTVRVPFDPQTDIVRWPDRYRDEKDDESQGGAGMWPRMMELLEVAERHPVNGHTVAQMELFPEAVGGPP